MDNFRIIPRLDIKAPYLVKGVHMEGLRQIGLPKEFSRNYFTQGADEILYMDIVASLFNRNQLHDLVSQTAAEVFIPITVGGGIRCLEDARQVLLSGADKIAINTGAVKYPELIQILADQFGSQSIIVSIEAKKIERGRWECYTDNGREKTNKDVMRWVKDAVRYGAGEILLTSVDREGTLSGFDVDLMQRVSQLVDVPVIAGGGMGTLDHLLALYQNTNVAGVALASMLHYKKLTINQIKEFAFSNGIPVRLCDECLSN